MRTIYEEVKEHELDVGEHASNSEGEARNIYRGTSLEKMLWESDSGLNVIYV